jgi:lipopolysaccharide transport system ATP-binding protein
MTNAVEASNLGKMYKRYGHPAARLAEWATLGHLVRHEPHWVLRNVNLAVGHGECFGIIGQNGSGKSTLLKILSGVVAPSEGTFAVQGRCSALLELGLGFHPDFTGRQNASLALRLQGLSAEESEQLLPAVESFAEIGDYMDQPVRTYSSGMQVRLAFSTATAFRPEVLIVDESLAVGDAYFQHKCFEKLRAFKASGTAMLFVSHDATAVRSLCDRAMLLDRGTVAADGAPGDVLDVYNAFIAKKEADVAIKRAETERGVSTVRSGNGRCVMEEVELLNAAGEKARAFLSGEHARLRVKLRASEPMAFPTVGMLIRDVKGNDVFGTNTYHLRVKAADLEAQSEAACEFDFPMNLGPGGYTITAALHTEADHVACNYDWWDKVIGFEVIAQGGDPFFIGVAKLQVRATAGLKLEGL